MTPTMLHPLLHCLVASSFVIASAFGPPRIAVKPVSSPGSAAGAAAFTIESEHHSDREQLAVTGRAEGLRDGKRVSKALTLVSTGEGRYSVAKQWDDESAWVLIFAAEQGPRGSHGVAEALVTISARGVVTGIVYPTPGWTAPGNTPKRTTASEIDASLATLAARR